MNLKRKLFKTVCIALIILFSYSTTNAVVPAAPLPVFDGINLPQNVMAAVAAYNDFQQSILQLKQLKEEFEYTVKNTLSPAFWVWDQVQSFEDNVERLRKKFEYLINGGLEDYVKQYISVDFYRNSPCFKFGGCSYKEMAQLKKAQKERLKKMSETSTFVAKGLKNVLDSMDNLERKKISLQLQTTLAGGSTEAIQYGNQWLGLLNDQLEGVNENLMTLQQQFMVMADDEYHNKSENNKRIELNLNDRLNDKVPTFKIPQLR